MIFSFFYNKDTRMKRISTFLNCAFKPKAFSKSVL